MANYEYGIIPWQWHEETDPGGTHGWWRMPSGVVGAIDLGKEGDFASPGSDREYAFAAAEVGTLSAGDVLATGDIRDIDSTTTIQNAWNSLLGFRPSGAKLVDLLFDHLTDGSDADWSSSVMPLMPGLSGNLQILLPGHSVIKSERFEYQSHRHKNKVRDVYRNIIGRRFDESGLDHAERVLGYYALRKHPGADWQDFVPPRLRGTIRGPQRPSTTYNDPFTYMDGDLSASGNWSYLSGSTEWDVLSGQVIYEYNTGKTERNCLVRYDLDLSEDDHYAKIDCVAVGINSMMPCAATRCHGTSNETAYMGGYRGNGNDLKIWKYVTGTGTEIADGTHSSISPPWEVKMESDGSSQTLFIDDSNVLSTTDTSIVGNVRCGMSSGHNMSAWTYTMTVDDFEASDLTVTISGSAAQTLPSLTQSASGVIPKVGTASQTLPSLTQSASGVIPKVGTIAQTLPSLTQSATSTTIDSITFTSESLSHSSAASATLTHATVVSESLEN